MYFKLILILILHELGTCFLEIDLSVLGTDLHLVERLNICTTFPDWNDSSDSYD